MVDNRWMHRPTRPTRHRRHRRAGAVLAVAATLATGLVALDQAPAAAEEVHVVPADRVLDLTGRGFGHGRGMSQWGARGAAGLGVGFQQILSTYYPGTTPTDAGNPAVRIRLTRTTGAVVVVTGALSHVDDVATGAVTALPAGTSRCEGRPSGTGVALRCLSGTTWTDLGQRAGVQVRGSGGLAVDRPGGYRNTYRGAVRVVRDGASVVGVAVMTMQEYLYGVVPNESPASWPADALRAQAVAARTYADRGRRAAAAGAAWDLCDTTACQVFDGTRTTGPDGSVVEEEAAATTRAVDETAGYELFWQGAPAFTEFSAANGGWSVAGSGAAAAYTPARQDPWDGATPSTAHSWTAPMPVSSLEARWPAVGRMTRFVVVSRDGRGELGGRVEQVRLEGVDGAGRATAVTVTGEQVRSAAGLKSRWFAVVGAGADPVGGLGLVSSGPGSILVDGWAADPDAPRTPIRVHVYVDGVARASLLADKYDVNLPGPSYPELGEYHRFAGSIAVPAAPSHRVCAYGINVGPGANALLWCRTVTNDRAPVGNLDSVSPSFAGAEVSGWTIDPDTTGSIWTHVYLDGSRHVVKRADGARPDVGRQYPDYGPLHGLTTRVSTLAGRHTVCAYGIDTTGRSTNTTLGCRDVVIGSAPGGAVDLVEPRTAGVRVRGWAADPETTVATRVHVYVDGRARGSATADRLRQDVENHHPVLGGYHGYDAVLPAMGGTQQVCTYAINLVTAGPNTTLGCRQVTVPSEPLGALDAVGADRTGVSVRGWALDPDTTAPVQVHVYVDGVGRGVLTAASSRPDVARQYPLHGAAHGYDVRLPVALAAGDHQVCTYAVNTGAGSGANPLLGCRTVTVG